MSGNVSNSVVKEILKEQKGMMTVEAAAIVPAISLILVGVVFLFLFFVDMAIAKSETIRIATETAAAWKTDGSPASGEYETDELLGRDIYFLASGDRSSLAGEAESRMTRRIGERLLITRLEQSTVTVKGQQVRAEAGLTLRWPLRGVEKIMGRLFSFSCRAVSPVDCWQEQLRLGACLQ